MRLVSKLLILAVCLAIATSLSPAQPPKGKKGDDFKGGPKGGMSDEALVEDIVSRMMAFDKNKDGKLTREEITDARLLRLFDKADANKAGVVTKDELLAVAKQMVADLASEGGGKGGPGGGKGGPGGGKGPPPGGGKKGGPGGFGPDGGGPPKGAAPTQTGQILSPFLLDALRLSDEQKNQVGALQAEVEVKLAKILTDDQKQQLKEMQTKGPKK
jgi:EF hand